jgi:hypothetical protein|tara:strand:+ start:1023 stop:1394 length:372 start_codon:yes stop_codon:yes gene_type:complete
MITDDFRTSLATHLAAVYQKARIGVGGNSTNPLTTDLDVPILDVSASASQSDNNVIEFKFTVTGASIAGYTIRELGIFNKQYDNGAGTTIAEYTELLTRIPFEGIGPFASGEDVDFYVTIEVE